MMYVKEFGVPGDSTMLPRQFYRLPAHKQYSSWPKLLSSTCANPEELLLLYRRIRAEDWFQLRRHPQFLGRGWSQACVPDEAQRECCAAPAFNDRGSSYHRAMPFSEVPDKRWLLGTLLMVASCGVLLFVVARSCSRRRRSRGLYDL